MMDKNQSQKAGDNSQQMQITNCPITVINGIDEKRAREISVKVFNMLRKELTNEARDTAEKRVQKFEDELIPRMQKMDKALIAFSDPAFQFLLAEAQRTAAKTERQADYELLSELLIRRVEKGSDRNIRAGINKAVEIVDNVSEEALLFSTLLFFMKNYTPTTGIISNGLDTLDEIFKKIIHNEMPIDLEWMDNLEILGAIRTSVMSSILSVKTSNYEDVLALKMSGYCVIGIKKDSENHNKAIAMLNEANLSLSSLCDHELNSGYVRLPLANEGTIDSLNLNEKQNQTLREIFLLYERNEDLKREVRKKFFLEIESRKYLNIGKEWWNNLANFPQLTSVGKALAYANIKRIYPDIPPVE